jgi:hypothetical protein
VYVLSPGQKTSDAVSFGLRPLTVSDPSRRSGRAGGVGRPSPENLALAIVQASGPVSRTSPRNPKPGGLATAAIVSVGSRVLTEAYPFLLPVRVRDDYEVYELCCSLFLISFLSGLPRLGVLGVLAVSPLLFS